MWCRSVGVAVCKGVVTGFSVGDIPIATPRRIAIAGQIACLGFAVEIGIVAAIIAGFFHLGRSIATIASPAGAAGIAMRLERPGIGVLSPIVTELLALNLTISTDRGDRAAVRGAVVAILGIAIIAGFPSLAGTIATARAWLVGRAANIVEDWRADALVGFTAFGAFRTWQAFPVGGTVGRTFAKEQGLVGVLWGLLAAGWQDGG